jgi:hypothetical protein
MGCMSNKLWSRSRTYTTLAQGRDLPPKVEITHNPKAESEVFAELCQTYPYVKTTFERTTWILGLQIETRGMLQKKDDHPAVAGE